MRWAPRSSTCSYLLPIWCMWGIDARMRVPGARVQPLATRCSLRAGMAKLTGPRATMPYSVPATGPTERRTPERSRMSGRLRELL